MPPRLKRAAPILKSLPPAIGRGPKLADPFYLSSAWRALIADIKRQRGNRCQHPGCNTGHMVIIGDHIIARRDGGADLDPLNIRLLCLPHHNSRTFGAQG
jgi:5-methylcytosine-specific restriction enzyme A